MNLHTDGLKKIRTKNLYSYFTKHDSDHNFSTFMQEGEIRNRDISNPLNQLRIYWKIQRENPGCMTDNCSLNTRVPHDTHINVPTSLFHCYRILLVNIINCVFPTSQ